MYGIIGAITRLNRLAIIIRHSPRLDEMGNVQNFAAKQDPDVEVGFSAFVSKTLRDVFPNSEETLRSQLAESVIYRRHRLLWNLRRARKLAEARQKENPVKLIIEKPPTFDPKLPQPRESHVQQHRAAWSGENIQSATEHSKGEFAEHPASSSRDDELGAETAALLLPTARYPDCPKIPAGATHIQCQYCLKHVEIPNKATQEMLDSFWRFAGISVCRLK